MEKKSIFFIFVLLILFLMPPTVFADQIELQNGEKLRGDVQNDSLSLQTPYAKLNVQTQYINKLKQEIVDEEEIFVIRASENNKFSGQLLSEISFLVNGSERVFSASEIRSLDFSDNEAFDDNKEISVKLKNGDLFFASTVENAISINTSLGSPLNINYENLLSIEYLSNEETYLVKRKNSSDIKSELEEQKIIIWPAAAEIVEVEFDYINKITFN
ncbi:MAG: hypothetical protein ACOC4L_01710 [Halanaerobium sp.]